VPISLVYASRRHITARLRALIDVLRAGGVSRKAI
jgi:hypothetical protein